MEKSNSLIEQLRADIKAKVGKSLDTPTDFDFLSNEIQQHLKEYISPTTLKRFFNYIPSNVIPRVSTLNVLARYIGYNGWEEYCANSGNSLPNELITIKHKQSKTFFIRKRERVFVATIVITAIISSFISFNVGVLYNKSKTHLKKNLSNNLYEEDAIQIYDSLSKLVILNAQSNCMAFIDTLRNPGCNKGKIVYLNKFNRKHKIGRDNYPIEVLDKYVPRNTPEYNLYRTSLVQLSDQIYSGFYEKNLDSLKIEYKVSPR